MGIVNSFYSLTGLALIHYLINYIKVNVSTRFATSKLLITQAIILQTVIS